MLRTVLMAALLAAPTTLGVSGSGGSFVTNGAGVGSGVICTGGGPQACNGWSTGGGVFAGPAPQSPPTYCGRKCNCGTGTGATIETDAGERVAGYTPPSGEHCACAEVYRCDAKSAGAPDQQSYCSLPGWGNGIYLTTPAVGSGGL